MRRTLFAFLMSVVATVAAAADESIIAVTWNVESGGAHPDTVGARIASMDGVDIWGLCEVDPSWALPFEQQAEAGEPGDFKALLGGTGGNDRLLILYDMDQFEELGVFEIGWEDRYWQTPSMQPRSAFVAHLRHKAADQEFFFMANHLYRGNGVDPRRLDQAKALRDWAAGQAIPVIACGDYNFDFDLDSGDAAHNMQKGLGDMTACGTFVWLEPANKITTHDSSFNSILDFFFLANAGERISGASQILVEDGDFPDNDETPDHRPVQATITFRPAGQAASLKSQLQTRIALIETELSALRVAIAQLDD